MQESPNLFWKGMELRKCKVAEMADFFTKALFKNAQKQSHKGVALKLASP